MYVIWGLMKYEPNEIWAYLPGNTYYMCTQFGCGILKMVGTKKHDFWPEINIGTQRKPLYSGLW